MIDIDTPFYHGIIRKTVIAFGQLFNGIYVQRTTEQVGQGDRIQLMKVPLVYGPKQKWVVFTRQNPDNPIATHEVTVPRLAFEITTIDYDSARQLQPPNRIVKQNSDGETMSSTYTPAPYIVHFALYIITRNQDDGLQILEQILPFFRPNYDTSVVFVPDLEESKTVTFTLGNIQHEDDYEGPADTKPTIIWTLDFSCKVDMYGPVLVSGPIKKVIATIYPNMPGYDVPLVDRYTAEVDPPEAGPEDDYDILEEWELVPPPNE